MFCCCFLLLFGKSELKRGSIAKGGKKWFIWWQLFLTDSEVSISSSTMHLPSHWRVSWLIYLIIFYSHSYSDTEETDMKRYDLMHSINTRGTYLLSVLLTRNLHWLFELLWFFHNVPIAVLSCVFPIFVHRPLVVAIPIFWIFLLLLQWNHNTSPVMLHTRWPSKFMTFGIIEGWYDPCKTSLIFRCVSHLIVS